MRVQWDPERSTRLGPLAHRAVQVGLSGEAVHRYVDEWVLGLTDVTALAHEVHGLVRAGEIGRADALVPVESAYPLPAGPAARIGATG